jgi:hypothetical protein
VTVSRIVVAAGAATDRGLSEPSAATKKSAGRNAVAAPLLDGIVPVVCVLVAGAVAVVVPVVAVAVVPVAVVPVPVPPVPVAVPVVGLVDDPPHPATVTTSAIVATSAPAAERLPRLISATPEADKPLTGVEMRPVGRRRQARLFEYDAHRRRLWIHGQRFHHGAGGTLVAVTAVLGLLAAQVPRERHDSDSKPLLALVFAGGALMAHDWKDRSVWFQRGRGPRH